MVGREKVKKRAVVGVQSYVFIDDIGVPPQAPLLSLVLWATHETSTEATRTLKQVENWIESLEPEERDPSLQVRGFLLLHCLSIAAAYFTQGKAAYASRLHVC